MFTSFKQCYDRYREEFKEYLQWFEEKKRYYAEFYNVKPEESLEKFDKSDYEKVMNWGNELTAMERALGILRGESQQIVKELKEEIKQGNFQKVENS